MKNQSEKLITLSAEYLPMIQGGGYQKDLAKQKLDEELSVNLFRSLSPSKPKRKTTR